MMIKDLCMLSILFFFERERERKKKYVCIYFCICMCKFYPGYISSVVSPKKREHETLLLATIPKGAFTDGASRGGDDFYQKQRKIPHNHTEAIRESLQLSDRVPP